MGIGADEKAYRSVNRLSAPHDDVLTSLLFDRAAEAEPGCRVEMEVRFRF